MTLFQRHVFIRFSSANVLDSKPARGRLHQQRRDLGMPFGGISKVYQLLGQRRRSNADFKWELTSRVQSCKTGWTYSENTRLLRKSIYHCTADLLFDWFGFSCFVELNYKQICLFGQILTGQKGGQAYSDISTYEVSECSLTKLMFKCIWQASECLRRGR